MGQEAREGMAEGGERRSSQPGLQSQARSQASKLIVVKTEPSCLHLLLSAPLGSPVLKPNLESLILMKTNFIVLIL